MLYRDVNSIYPYTSPPKKAIDCQANCGQSSKNNGFESLLSTHNLCNKASFQTLITQMNGACNQLSVAMRKALNSGHKVAFFLAKV